MCGIIYLKSLDNREASQRLWKRFNEQRNRGVLGFGYVAIDNKAFKRFSGEAETLEAIQEEKSREIMFHHRQPTSTVNIPEAAHPIKISNSKMKHRYYVVHNGVISNAETLKTEHNKLGYKYSTEITSQTLYSVKGKKYQTAKELEFNDSEALAYDLALYLEGKQKKLEAKGSIAFICLETDKQNKPIFLHYGRNTNPLIVEKTKELLAIKSQGSGQEIDSHRLYSYCYATDKTEINPLDIGENYKLGGYWESYKRPIGFEPVGSRQKPKSDELLLLEWEIEDLTYELSYYEPSPKMFAAELAEGRARLKELNKKADQLRQEMKAKEYDY